MSWSYNPTQLSSSQKDQVRYLIQDTDSSDQLLSDEEINYEITRSGSVRLAASRIARTIAAKFSRKVDESAGKVSKKWSQLSTQYYSLADRLEAEAEELVAPFAGGLSESGKDTYRNDDDRVDPFFTRDTGDFRRHDSDPYGRCED